MISCGEAKHEHYYAILAKAMVDVPEEANPHDGQASDLRAVDGCGAHHGSNRTARDIMPSCTECISG